jgi:hypothetical protein
MLGSSELPEFHRESRIIPANIATGNPLGARNIRDSYRVVEIPEQLAETSKAA